jgi:hypothetical protein
MRQFPGNGRLIFYLSAVEEHAGNHEQAINLARQAVERLPNQQTQAWLHYLLSLVDYQGKKL